MLPIKMFPSFLWLNNCNSSLGDHFVFSLTYYMFFSVLKLVTTLTDLWNLFFMPLGKVKIFINIQFLPNIGMKVHQMQELFIQHPHNYKEIYPLITTKKQNSQVFPVLLFVSPWMKLSGLKRAPMRLPLILSIVPGSRSTSRALGTYLPPANRTGMYTYIGNLNLNTPSLCVKA